MFKGLGNLGNLASMMGSLQQLPEKLKELNEQMQTSIVTHTSSCSNVTVAMSGTGQVQSVDVSGDLQGESLEQAILEATNAAGAAAKQMYAEAIKQMAADMDINIPGMDGLLTSLTGGS